jgi:hypothetical protein
MQESETGSTPRPIQLFRRGYKGSNPEHPNAMCSQVAEDPIGKLFIIFNYLLIIQTLSCKFGF